MTLVLVVAVVALVCALLALGGHRWQPRSAAGPFAPATARASLDRDSAAARAMRAAGAVPGVQPAPRLAAPIHSADPLVRQPGTAVRHGDGKRSGQTRKG